ncbi:hypothetical protein ACFFRR_005513 [Megaselia abdita]
MEKSRKENESIRDSKSVCDQMLEYYFKFGQNRDLEKFLRLRKSYNNLKSSSEGSIGSNKQYKIPCNLDLSKNMSCPDVHELHRYSLRKQAECFSITDGWKDNGKDKPETSILTNISSGCPNIDVNKFGNVSLKSPVVTSNSQKSPDSVLKSQKKLEWDSLGDIGYRSNSNSDSISTLERSVLKDFFAKRGMQVNFSTHKKKNLDKLFATLKNVKGSPVELEEQSEDLTAKFLDLPHSTPKTPLVEILEELESSQEKPIEINTLKDGVQELPNYDSSSKDLSKNCISNPLEKKTEFNKSYELNKYCQTSGTCMQNQYTQADLYISKSNTYSTNQSMFIASENVSSSFEYMKGNSTKNHKKQNGTKSKTEVELGIQLLCSLIESNNLNIKEKTRLANSIVKRLTRNDSLDILVTSCYESISESSLTNVKCFPCNVNRKVELKDKRNEQTDRDRFSLPSKTKCHKSDTSQYSNETNEINTNYYNVVENYKVDNNFEARLKNIEAQLNKINFYKNTFLTSDNNSFKNRNSKKSNAGISSSKILNRATEFVTQETGNYRENVYNPTMNYKRYAHKNEQKTNCYQGVKRTQHCSTNISIDEEYPIAEKDERVKLRTPSSTSAYDIKTNSLINKRKESHHYSEPTYFKAVLKKDYVYETPSSSETSCVILPYSSSYSQSENASHIKNAQGLQENNSLKNNIPIRSTNYNCCIKTIEYCHHNKTSNVKANHSKHIQAKPPSIAYVINFKNNFELCTNSSYSSEESLTLQDFLKHEKPDFYLKANRRQQILNEIRSLRYVRNEQLRNIIANESDVEKIEEELKNLPPEPMKQIRIFSSKKLKESTKKKYAQLPEVLEKLNRKRQDKVMKDNRKLTNIFNKVNNK